MLAAEAKSQTQVGLRLGVNGSRVGGSAVTEVTKTGIGYNAGLFAKIDLEGFYLQPELVVSYRTSSFIQSFSDSLTLNPILSEKNIKATYLDFPVILLVELSKNVNLLIGPQFSINVGNKQTASDSLGRGLGYGFRWFEIGITGGVNYVFPSGIDLSLRAFYGLTPVFTKTNLSVPGENQPAISSRLLQFTIGLPISTAAENEPDRSSYKTIY